MLVIDDYLAVEVILGDWPAGLPDDDTPALPASRHFRLLQRIHQTGGLLTVETLAAGLSSATSCSSAPSATWAAASHNVAADLGIAVHVIGS